MRYIQAPHIALDYDLTFADTALFAHDCELMDTWFPEPGRLLDLGCGTGRHVAHFARRGFEVTGVDLSPHMLEVARRKLARQGLKATLIQGNMLELDTFGLAPVRYATCMFSTLGMVQGLANRVRFLEQIRGHVVPGGLLALHAHNALRQAWAPWGPIWWLGALAWVKARGLEFGDRILSVYRSIPDLFIHLFTEKEIRSSLQEAGWDLVEFVYLNLPRNGPLRLRVARGLRANGFVALARRPT